LGDRDCGLSSFGDPILGDQTDSRFGKAITSGDFNGDSFSDLAVGAPTELILTGFSGSFPTFADSAGEVFIINGSSSAGNLTNFDHFSQIWSQHSAGILGTAEEGDQFGSVLAARDFDGNGRSDLAIGVPLEDVGSKEDAG